VMVSFSNLLSNREIFIAKKSEILEATKELFNKNEEGTFTGRGNTKADIQNRIDLFSNMLEGFLD